MERRLGIWKIIVLPLLVPTAAHAAASVQRVMFCDETMTTPACREELGHYDCSGTQGCVWVRSFMISGGAEADSGTSDSDIRGHAASEENEPTAATTSTTQQTAYRRKAQRISRLEGVRAATVSFLAVAEGLTQKGPAKKRNPKLVKAGLQGIGAAFVLQQQVEGEVAPLLLDGRVLASKEAVKVMTELKRDYSIEPGKLLEVLASSPHANLRKVLKKEELNAVLSVQTTPEALEAELAKSKGWSIRDRLRRALANHSDYVSSEPESEPDPVVEVSAEPEGPSTPEMDAPGRSPASESGQPEYGLEGLTPEAKEFFPAKSANAVASEEKGLSLFDVVHLKYREIAERRAASRRLQAESLGAMGED